MSVDIPKNIARYVVERHLEVGGMGSVFLARDPAIDRNVAIKLLKEGFDNAELRERFMREARSAGSLRHINIVTIFDVGEHEKQPFIAMEYVEGETLHALIKRKAALSLGRKIQLMDELAAGLQYAHRAGIVHRDIKPKNVMLDADGVLKVLDFGIARVSDSGQGGIKTQAGMLMGTLNYMAPEQMMGLPDIDARADMFSAGAVFYELLAYQQAFPGGLETGILHKIINANPEPLLSIDPRLDKGLVAIVEKCLEKSRDKRYPDMAAVRRDLSALRRRLGVDDEQESGAETITGGRAPTAEEAAVTPRPVRKDSSKQELDRLRAAQIRTYLDDAKKALDNEDFTAALDASQRALLLKDDDREAVEYEQRARAAIDERQASQLLTEAKGEIDRGALTAASMLVGRAESLSPASREAAAVRAQLEDARRQMAEAQARAKALEAAIALARETLRSGALEAATERVNEALALEPGNADALQIQREITAAVEARRRAAEEARAREAMQAAREKFATGDHAAAIQMLERFSPIGLVAEALGELRIESQEIERRRREAERRAEQARKAAEEARKAEEARAAEEARKAEAARKAEEARQAAERAEAEAAARRAREAEEKRAADEKRAAEERKKAAERVAAEEKRAAEERKRAAAEADQTIRFQAPVVPKEAPLDQTIVIPRGQAETPTIVSPKPTPKPAPVAKADAPPLPMQGAEGAATIVLSSAAIAEAAGKAAPIQAPPIVDDRKPAPPSDLGKYLGIAAALLVVIGIGYWVFGRGETDVKKGDGGGVTRPTIETSPTPGSVVLDIAPWANIDAITKKDGAAAPASPCKVTPCVLSLPAGEYHVRASNPNFQGPLEFDVAVEAGQVREVRQAIPGFKAEDEISKILDK